MSGLVQNEVSNGVTSPGSTSSAWITDVFDCYEIPLELGQDLPDEDTHQQYQVRHLGPAYLKCGSFSVIQAFFYEVTRSEISEVNKVKRHSHCSSSGVDGTDIPSDLNGGGPPSKDADALQYLSETSQTPLPGSNSSITTGTSTVSSSTLPPKKRKMRMVMQHYVIFSLTKDHHDSEGVSSLYPDCTYYLFPRNSLMDAVNGIAPFQIFCTIQLTKPPSTLQHAWTICDTGSSLSPASRNKQWTRLEDLAAVCDSSDNFLSIGPHDQVQTQLADSHSFASENQSINVEISGASGDIYYSLKQSVSGYQTSCQKMADLLNIHNQWATSCKDDFLPSERHSTSPTTYEQTTEDHHQNINTKTGNVLSPQHDQQHDDTEQQQNTHTSNDEQEFEYYEDSAVAETWSFNEKSAEDYESKSEALDKDYIPPSSFKKKKTYRNSTSRNEDSSTPTRKCIYCKATSTPMWRRGPQGAGTLCNACGVKWKNGRILFGNEAIAEFNNTKKRKRSATRISDEKKFKTTNDITSATVDSNITMEDDVDASSTDLRLHKSTSRHTESTTTTDNNHLQSFRSTNYDSNGTANTSSFYSKASSTPLSAMATTKDTGHLHHSSASSNMSTQQSVILSSESIYNSPLTSFTSTPNSSPPMSMYSQQNRGFLALPFTDKLELDDGNGKLPLAPGTDDVEAAAAVLTLLRQS